MLAKLLFFINFNGYAHLAGCPSTRGREQLFAVRGRIIEKIVVFNKISDYWKKCRAHFLVRLVRHGLVPNPHGQDALIQCLKECIALALRYSNFMAVKE